MGLDGLFSIFAIRQYGSDYLSVNAPFGIKVSDRAHLRFCLTLLVRFADVLFSIGET